MFDTEAILAQVDAGQTPPAWRIIHAQSGYFIKSLLGYLVLTVVLIAVLFYMSYAHVVYVPGYSSDPLSSNEFHTWQIIDFAVIGLFLLVFVIASIQGILDISNVKKQVLILMPEGFIMKKKVVQAIAYADVASMKANVSRSNVGLVVTPISGGKANKVGFDGRFGNAKQIITGIMNTQHAYTTMNVHNI